MTRWHLGFSHAIHDDSYSVAYADAPCQDLSWKNAGSQLAKYLTNNLQEEPWRQEIAATMNLSKNHEDAPPFAGKN